MCDEPTHGQTDRPTFVAPNSDRRNLLITVIVGSVDNTCGMTPKSNKKRPSFLSQWRHSCFVCSRTIRCGRFAEMRNDYGRLVVVIRSLIVRSAYSHKSTVTRGVKRGRFSTYNDHDTRQEKWAPKTDSRIPVV